MSVTLAIPDEFAKSHSHRLSQAIREEIQCHGPIPFARYMELALYAPGLGYYRAGTQKFGACGDFVTAPELSPLFSQCLARQCESILSEMGEANILELGAGSGIMALHLLQTLEKRGALPEQYYILELSAELKQRQRMLFEEQAPLLLDRIRWLDRLPKNPFKGIILGNEVIDAMPVDRFTFVDGLKAFYVDANENGFMWKLGPAGEQLTNKIQDLNISFSEHYESEINVLLDAWLASLSDCLEKGVILLIDYGYPRHEYYHPDRSMGTLMCYYRHRAHGDPFFYPGIQDMTAHVDFTAVAESAIDHHFNVSGFTSQAGFLINCGITEDIRGGNDLEHFELAQQVKRLTLPSEMGELYKVIALTKNYHHPLLGFIHNDQRARL